MPLELVAGCKKSGLRNGKSFIHDHSSHDGGNSSHFECILITKSWDSLRSRGGFIQFRSRAFVASVRSAMSLHQQGLCSRIQEFDMSLRQVQRKF